MDSFMSPTSNVKTQASSALLERDEERLLVMRAQRGDSRARDRIVMAHMRWVVASAKRMARGGILLDDLVQEGVLGLLEAIERFDVERDVRFATYAGYWVRERMRAHAASCRRMVAAPSTRAARVVLRGHRRASSRLSAELGRAPSREEIATALGVAEQDVASCEATMFRGDRAVGSEDGSGVFVEPVAETPGPEEAVAEAEEKALRTERVSAALARLGTRERVVVERRFLVDDDDEQSLVEVGTQLGVSRERARQIQEVAREKLRLALCA